MEFFRHEGVLILRFCDLMVLSMLGVDEDVREELATNLWDEVGNGNYQNRHTELFRRLLRHAGVRLPEASQVSVDDPRALRPLGGRPVKKRRRPTSWVSVSMLIPRTTQILSAWLANSPMYGPSHMLPSPRASFLGGPTLPISSS